MNPQPFTLEQVQRISSLPRVSRRVRGSWFDPRISANVDRYDVAYAAATGRYAEAAHLCKVISMFPKPKHLTQMEGSR